MDQLLHWWHLVATPDLLIFAAVGFAAQMVDGAIGMAYGLTASSVMMALGIPPAVASATVHTAEIFTTAASGYSHWRLKNVDRRLFSHLVVPGMIGGVAGALLLSRIDGEAIKPWVSGYLLIMGGVILWKALRHRAPDGAPPKRVELLGLVGGFLDSVGGGGWGPLVTSTLLGRGTTPRLAIGSVNLAEFFVTFAVSATFYATISLALWPNIVGLVIGGVCAAPLAALVTKKVPAKPLMLLVGCVIVLLGARRFVLPWLGIGQP